MQKTQKAFTLVELIVVITILAILGTISFISLQGYSKKARDSKRTADIANIKVSLELFSLNTGYYPLPDNGEEVLYDNDLLWTQGVVGTNVTTNLSRNLLKKPTDPLHDIEYIYSLASSKKEYEVMSIYEGDLANNSLINSTYASDKYSIKVEGNYNELFIKTSKHIFSVPSLITSALLPLDFDLVPSAIESQVITGGSNFPSLNIPNIETSTGGLKMTLSVYTGSINKDSIDDVKKAVVEKIQLAYSGSDIATTSIYKTLLEKTTDEELLAFVDDVVLNKGNSSIVKDTNAPTGGNFSMDTDASIVNIVLTITCPEEEGVEMYISGDIVDIPSWESCTSSKNITLTDTEGTKNINVKYRDNNGNETGNINKTLELLLCEGNNLKKLTFNGKNYCMLIKANAVDEENCSTLCSNAGKICNNDYFSNFQDDFFIDYDNIDKVNAWIPTVVSISGNTWNPNTQNSNNINKRTCDDDGINKGVAFGCSGGSFDVYSDWTMTNNCSHTGNPFSMKSCGNWVTQLCTDNFTALGNSNGNNGGFCACN